MLVDFVALYCIFCCPLNAGRHNPAHLVQKLPFSITHCARSLSPTDHPCGSESERRDCGREGGRPIRADHRAGTSEESVKDGTGKKTKQKKKTAAPREQH